jgi:sialate O-acetylesterase
VDFAGQRVSTTVDQAGRWALSIDPRAYGGPHELIVQNGKQRITIKDILIGEVWLCGGQSNMQWTVSQSGDADTEVAAADWPDLRLYAEPLHVTTQPQQHVQGRWAVCDPQSAADFSAAAYYFGRHLHQELDVPIGLILVAWGGSPAEAWTSSPTLHSNADLAVIKERYDKHMAAHPDLVSEYQAAVNQFMEPRIETDADEHPDHRPPPSAYAMSNQTRFFSGHTPP